MKDNVLPITGYTALESRQSGYKKLLAGEEAEKRRIRNILHKCFAQTPEGKAALSLLIGWTLVRPVAPPGCHNGYPFFREGQNDIVRSILEAIEDAEK